MIKLARPFVLVLWLYVTTLVHFLRATIFRLLGLIVAFIFATEPNAQIASIFAHVIRRLRFITTTISVLNRIGDSQRARTLVVVSHPIAFGTIRQNLETILEPPNVGLGAADYFTIENQLVGTLNVFVWGGKWSLWVFDNEKVERETRFVIFSKTFFLCHVVSSFFFIFSKTSSCCILKAV